MVDLGGGGGGVAIAVVNSEYAVDFFLCEKSSQK